jgi:hypothetical protein
MIKTLSQKIFLGLQKKPEPRVEYAAYIGFLEARIALLMASAPEYAQKACIAAFERYAEENKP